MAAPGWLRSQEPPPRATRRPSVYIPAPLLKRWQEAERRGRVINLSKLVQEALAGALDVLEADAAAAESWRPRKREDADA
jgi:hypothetical protein